MARTPRDPRLRRDTPGQRPLLQGHLRPGGRPTVGESASTQPADQPESTEPEGVEPAAEGVGGAGDAARGKATRSPEEVATRRHLEGSEQGPS